ncbi:tellurium resistance protein TerZ [Rhodoblastus acidophilus]|uniref:Tellurium resistance protein TerZ n=1 Tax=Rhodoblastus acidophilus TaxID=1074 RepID=A0A212SG51_RHOAC|nr:TerD family protein [Rhodoblastus acidophilus]PPQ34828.1 Tellurium resistance protein terZ [Rhodoblastus acidophilus]RAI16602.1 Tellurium resistance protein terZ [Rhodoblastus acidophilus]SNB84572.1 tellurium resistance protein TerZ [Rhodoblastus acidophilus]
MSISLAKGQTVDLSKTSNGLSRIRMGLGWDAAAKKSGGFLSSLFGGGAADSIDLDASCIVFDANNQAIDVVWFRQLRSKDGSIQHSGDNQTGEGDGDDETIFVDLSRLPAHIDTLVFTVNSFRGQTFNEVDNAVCRVVDDTCNKELVRFNLAEKGAHNGVIMAVITRRQGPWSMKAVGAPTSGQTVQDLIPAALAAI